MYKHLGTHLKLTYSNLTVKLGIRLGSLKLALFANTFECAHSTFFIVIYVIEYDFKCHILTVITTTIYDKHYNCYRIIYLHLEFQNIVIKLTNITM